MTKLLDLSGRVFGNLTVIERDTDPKRKCVHWICRCACGKTTSIASTSLVKGSTKSCGCMRGKFVSRHRRTHGMGSHPEYNTWKKMINRCYDQEDIGYRFYGAKGIRVSKEWRESFEKFYEDMGPRPHGCSIDRIDSRGGYSKENCRWLPNELQNRNQARVSKSGFIGVRQYGNRFYARCIVNRKAYHLGMFATAEEASAVREKFYKEMVLDKIEDQKSRSK